MRVSRRRFAALTGSAMASWSFGAFGSACGMDAITPQLGAARLTARPKPNIKTTASRRIPLDLGEMRDGALVMPSTIPATPLPLLVLLHGAGNTGERQLARFGSTPSDAGVAVLAVDSRFQTWDGVLGGFGPDVMFLDRALKKVFNLVAVDPTRLTIGGFSDGASYGLSLGLINGDLFTRIAAFSPGFLINGEPHGKPRVFISHGTADPVLPIAQCSRVIVPELRKRGYDVTFREFAGGHEAPKDVGVEAFRWMAAGGASKASYWP